MTISPIIVLILVVTASRLIEYGRSTATASPTPGPITHHVFPSSIKENGAENGEHATPNLVIFPLHEGTSQGNTVWYVITESSDPGDATARGVNFSSKLANAKGTPAVQQVQMVNGMIDFPAT